MSDTAIESPYVDYNYYHETFGGSKITEAAFPSWEKRAEAVLHRITFNRILKRPELITEAILDNIRMAICAMSETDFRESKKTPGVKSENTDGYSVSYGDTGSANGEAGRIHEMYQSAMTYLHDTGLLFKGRSRIYDYQC